MRTIAILFSLLFIAKSCDVSTPPAQSTDGLKVTFSLLDTLSQQSNTFRSGEEFDMIFLISNLTGSDQIYYYTGPLVIFKIIQSDSLVASSVDGLAWPQVALSDTLKNGKSEKNDWRAPNSTGRNPRITLQPGVYSARATMGYGFANITPEQPSDIAFTVTP